MRHHKILIELHQRLHIIMSSIHYPLSQHSQSLLIFLNRLIQQLKLIRLQSQILNLTDLLITLQIGLIFCYYLFDCLVLYLALDVHGYVDGEGFTRLEERDESEDYGLFRRDLLVHCVNTYSLP